MSKSLTIHTHTVKPRLFTEEKALVKMPAMLTVTTLCNKKEQTQSNGQQPSACPQGPVDVHSVCQTKEEKPALGV